MFKLKVGKAETYQDIEQGETRLRVPFEIVDADGKTVEQRNESFPLATTVQEVQTMLQRHLTVYTEDHNRYEAGKEAQAALEQAGTLAEEISGITID